MKIGIGPCYLYDYGAEEGAKRMARHGYEYLDFDWYANTKNPKLYSDDEDEFIRITEAWRNTFQKNGYKVRQIHGPWEGTHTDRTEGARAERFEKMSMALRAASIIGAEYMAIHPIMPFGADKHTEEQAAEMWKINVDFFTRLADVGEKYGVTVCVENMPFKYLPISSAADVLKLAKEVNHPFLRICLDTGHANVVNPAPAEAVKLLGKDYLKILHVHGNDGSDDLHYNPMQVGDTVDWEAFSAALREIGFDGVVNLETSPRTGDTTDPEREEIELRLANAAKKIAGI